MVARVIRSVVLIALMGLTLTGCGRQVSQDSSGDPNLLATGPATGSMPVPRPFVAASIDAAGGLPAWTQCRKLQFDAVVTANYPDGGLYLTEQQLVRYPWSEAVQVTAGEPRVRLAWQVVQGRYSFEGDSELDVSPLKGSYGEYAEAILDIVTTPARVLDAGITFTRRPDSVQLAGQWYVPIDAKYQSRDVALGKKKESKAGQAVPAESSWTQCTYFQNQDKSFMDMIWLANPTAGKFLLVRGYDYSQVGGVLVPTKIEIFHSDPQAQFGPRIAMIDLKL